MQIKIVSLNLAGLKHWNSRKQKIVAFLDEIDADIILLQEVRFDPLVSAYSQSLLLNQALSTPFLYTQTTISRFYQPSIGEAYREGLGVLSRYPITNSESLALVRQADDKHTRIIQNVTVEIRGQKLLLTNIHFSNNQYSVDQLQEAIGICKARHERRILVGDFNILNLRDKRDIYANEYVASIDFKEYKSFPSEDITLDYALVPKEYPIISVEVYEGLSDHNALSITLNAFEHKH